MELTATTKSQDSFTLDDDDYAKDIVDQRMTATKRLRLKVLKEAKKPAKELIEKGAVVQWHRTGCTGLRAERGITNDERKLVLHPIAAHHVRARPHFPADEVFDPFQSEQASDELAMTVPQRFGRIQKRFGRWRLAYLESLLRAADWSASAKPSQEIEETV